MHVIAAKAVVAVKEIAQLIGLAFKNPKSLMVRNHILGSLNKITSQFPLYEGI